MWIIGIVLILTIVVIISFWITSKNNRKEEKKEKKIYAMPPQRKYPYLNFKDCMFFAEGSSRFTYSEDQIEQLISSLDESFNRTDYSKSLKLANEILKIAPNQGKVWLKKINTLFLEVMQKEEPWTDNYSKMILNCCYGFLQCYDNVIEKSIAAKREMLPILLKNTDDIIKFQRDQITKYHNFEVYNMLLNLYHVLPFKEILSLMSNRILEDKFDKELEQDPYAKRTLKSLLNHVDMLRTRHTSKLQETFDSKKITNCTLITDERISASIIAFELSFGEEKQKESIEAIFYDETGNEINFGKNPGERFIDIFQNANANSSVVKEEIVIFSDVPINKVKLRIYEEKLESANEKEDNQEKKQAGKNSDNKKNNSKKSGLSATELNKDEKSESETEEAEEEQQTEESLMEKHYMAETLVHPCFNDVDDIKISDSLFVAQKRDGTVTALGLVNSIEQLSTWENIAKIYIKDAAVFGVKTDGSVIYSGNASYDQVEYIYSWQNIERLSLGEKHLVALTSNSTVCAVGSNENGECDVVDWYDIIQVEAYYHTVGLSKDGKVRATGENNFGECDVKAWQDIVQVAVGEFYTLGLTASGKVLATGLNSCGQCNVGEWANIKKIYASANMSIGLRYDGKVVTAGKNSYRYDDVKKWERISALVVSNNRIIGIEQDGTVRATGKPYKNFVNEEWNEIKDVAINSDTIVGLKEDGTLVSNLAVFGYFLADKFDGILQIGEEATNNRIAILSDQNVLTISNKVQSVSILDEPYPTLYDIKKFDIGPTYLAAIKTDGTALYINLQERTIINIKEWDNMIDIKVGEEFIIGLNISGNVKLLGTKEYNKYDVSEWSDIVKIGAAGKRALGLTIDGKLCMTGAGEFAEEEFIKISKDIKDFAITDLQIMLLESDGTVKITYHPAGIGAECVSSWSNIKKVVARGENFIGLTIDGRVYSTIENEKEICKWEDIEDIEASLGYVWATLKIPE